MADKDVSRKAGASPSPGAGSSPIYKSSRESVAARGSAADTDRLGREQQRRATAYARARGQL